MATFANKTFIVTGGASGLGEATVRRFSALGGNVAIFDRDAERGQDIAKELGSNVAFYEMDATNEQSIIDAIKATVAKFGSVWAAVNCAGIGSAALTVNKKGTPFDSSMFDLVMNINLLGTFNTCKHAAAEMVKNQPDENGQRGVLINVASVAALEGQKGQVAYSASKGAVTAMTLPMARDLGQFGIRVMTICPGVMKTPMMAMATDVVIEGLSEGIVTPKRLGKADEFAMLAQQIVENAYLNGEIIRIDGGLRMAFSEKSAEQKARAKAKKAAL